MSLISLLISVTLVFKYNINNKINFVKLLLFYIFISFSYMCKIIHLFWGEDNKFIHTEREGKTEQTKNHTFYKCIIYLLLDLINTIVNTIYEKNLFIHK